MITITIEDDEDVTTLYNIMMEFLQLIDCISGECEHNNECRDE